MATQRSGQRWVLDALVTLGGWDILHPEVRGFFEELGYYHSDVDRVFGKVGSTLHFARAWGTTAQEVERKARWAEERGFKGAARDFYARAMLLYGRAQYGFYGDDPRKRAFHQKLVHCFNKVADYDPTPFERVELPFEGKKLYAIFALPGGDGPHPCVILGPGMDMFKEDWVAAMKRYFLPRGFACLSIDGPGQGESLLNGLKCTLDNYERAGSTFIDYLCTREEVDKDRIVLFGVSMGSYWGSRIAAHDERLKACATCMGCYGTMHVIFNVAQPNFKLNFMYMAGYEDEEKFDREVLAHMFLGDLVKKIKCPYLMAHGEFDELTPLDDAIATYERAAPPKEMWVYGNEYHPMGGVGSDFLSQGADWLLSMLEGNFTPDMDRRFFIEKDGTFSDKDVRPPWWSSA